MAIVFLFNEKNIKVSSYCKAKQGAEAVDIINGESTTRARSERSMEKEAMMRAKENNKRKREDLGFSKGDVPFSTLIKGFNGTYIF